MKLLRIFEGSWRSNPTPSMRRLILAMPCYKREKSTRLSLSIKGRSKSDLITLKLSTILATLFSKRGN